ncbi:peptidylprolyl isomerase [bacterium]|nr:peptidylprolyl isomerase [bacterium]
MMTQLRTQMKWIFVVLTVAFLGTIIFSWGMGGFKDRGEAGMIGEIDGHKITPEDFNDIVRFETEKAEQQSEEDLDEQKRKKIREDAWNNEIERILKLNDARKLGVKVSKYEIAHYVENYPPQEVQDAEVFQRDGRFDPSAYREYLQTSQAVPYLIRIEPQIRSFLFDQKLNFHVMQSADVSIEEVRDEYISQAVTGKLRFIPIVNDHFEVDSSEVAEEMLRRYYKLFANRFKKYPQARFAFVKFKTVPTAEDSQDVEHDAEELLKDIANGVDFSELAQNYSEDKTTSRGGGDLGWISRGSMSNDFMDAALEAQAGDIVGPVLTRKGYHVISIEDRRVEDGDDEVKAKHILLKIGPSADTRDQVYTDSYNFAQDVEEADFLTVADEYGYSVDTTESFSEAGYIKGIGRMRMAAEFCFNNTVGAVSGVYPVPEGYVVFKIVEITEEGLKPFEDARTTIYRSISKILQKNKAWDKAAELADRIETVEDMERVADEAGFMVYVTEDSLKPTGKLPADLKRDKEFLQQAFRLEAGSDPEIVQTKLGCYITYIENKSAWNEEEFLIFHSSIYQSLISRKRDQTVRNWIRELRIAADINDYRYMHFRDF